jgi:5-oxoprolinase (ATP-hydrolysing) subunit A
MAMDCVDFNSDMGEGFGPWVIGDGVDAEIMPLITSANIATGFHAGDPNIMRRMVDLANQHGVGLGAHPGLRDLVGFGRRFITAPPDELVNDVVYQLGALREFARLRGTKLQHVKPHGALYMLAARDEELSRVLIRALQAIEPTLYIYCMASSVTYRVAVEMGQPVVRELYADRDYDSSGSIVFTRRVTAWDPDVVARKVVRACLEGKVRCPDGTDIAIEFESICIHSDTPGALGLIEACRRGLDKAGVAVRPLPQVIAARKARAAKV